MLSAISLAGATAVVITAVWSPSLNGAVLLAIPAGILGGGWSVGIYAGLQYVLPDHLRATGTAIAMLAVNLLGYAVGPWAVGQLSVEFDEGAQGLRIALSIVVPIGFLGAFLIWRGSHWLEKDREYLSGDEVGQNGS